MATRHHASTTGPAAAGRTVPNLPGALVRRLSEQLAISPTVAMRVALLYGDIEWQAAGANELQYSARDYARRTGLHPHTVQADLRHLIAAGAIEASYTHTHAATLQLRGLAADPAANDQPPGREIHPGSPPDPQQPGRFVDPAPGRSFRPALVDETTKPWSTVSTTLEKPSKNQEKEDRKKKRGKLARSSGIQGQAEGQPGGVQSPEAGNSRGQEVQEAGVAGGAGAQAKGSAFPPEPRTQGPPEPKTSEPTEGPGGTDLLDRLLDAFRAAAPPEWPAPERLTPSRERRSRLRQALEHAGSLDALEARLRAALGAVPVWFRHTYPVRPDGSRRPAYQFFDLLLRASAAERDCGVEAWHLFAWSEASGGPSQQVSSLSPRPETDLQRAQRLFAWDSGRWLSIGIEALALTGEEKQRLASLLEEQGQGIAGTAARQFGPPSRAEPQQGPQPSPAMP